MAGFNTICILLLFFVFGNAINYIQNKMNFEIGELIIDKYEARRKVITYTMLKQVQFEVSAFSVTAGQDPAKKLDKLNVIKGTDKITINCGQSARPEVANWVNSFLLSPDRHTFGQNFKNANFALRGTFSFTLGDKFKNEKLYKFEDIIFMQHYVSGNVWGFGGKNCSKISGSPNTVICTGINSKNNDIVSLRFAAGDREKVTLSHSHELSLENWMGDIEGSRTLKSLIMPGSHDAGMSVLTNCDLFSQLFSIKKSAVQTQSLDITGQLNAGSRYFDIRPAFGKDNSDAQVLLTYHRSGRFGCDGETLQEVTDQVVNFLKLHPTETVIVKVSHVPQFNKSDKMYVQDKLREHFLQSGIQDRMFKLSDPSLEISKQKLQDLRGKMIVLFSYDAGKVNASEGVFRYSENMKVHDRYSNTNNLFDMEEDQLDKWYNIGLHNDKLRGYHQ